MWILCKTKIIFTGCSFNLLSKDTPTSTFFFITYSLKPLKFLSQNTIFPNCHLRCKLIPCWVGYIFISFLFSDNKQLSLSLWLSFQLHKKLTKWHLRKRVVMGNKAWTEQQSDCVVSISLRTVEVFLLSPSIQFYLLTAKIQFNIFTETSETMMNKHRLLLWRTNWEWLDFQTIAACKCVGSCETSFFWDSSVGWEYNSYAKCCISLAAVIVFLRWVGALWRKLTFHLSEKCCFQKRTRKDLIRILSLFMVVDVCMNGLRSSSPFSPTTMLYL